MLRVLSSGHSQPRRFCMLHCFLADGMIRRRKVFGWSRSQLCSPCNTFPEDLSSKPDSSSPRNLNAGKTNGDDFQRIRAKCSKLPLRWKLVCCIIVAPTRQQLIPLADKVKPGCIIYGNILVLCSPCYCSLETDHQSPAQRT